MRERAKFYALAVALTFAFVLFSWGIGEAIAIPYRLDAVTEFDPYGNETAWIRNHAALVKGYGSFAQTHYVARGLPTIDYHDPATEGYAPLTPANRARYMAKVEADRREGFLGVSNDDINLQLGFRDGAQNQSSYEPEAREEAALLAQERSYWPTGIIETNTQWHDLQPLLAHDPNAQSIVASTSIYMKEFGVGPTSGITTKADYESLLAFTDTLTAEGKNIVYSGDYHNKNVPEMEYNLASSLLAGHAYSSTSGVYALPPTWWTGSDAACSEPLQARWDQNGARSIYSRLFFAPAPPLTGQLSVPGPSHGCLVLADPPQGREEAFSWGWKARSVEWGERSSVTLKAGQGGVFVWTQPGSGA